LSAIVSVAVAEPTAIGVNVTESVQEEPAAREVAQVEVIAKAAAFVPARDTELIARAAVPLLVRVKVWAVLVTPVTTLPKLAVAGVRAAWGAGAAAAVPERDAVWVPTASVTESVAVSVPTAVGAKDTAMVQEAPAATVAPQVLVPMLKLELLAPVMLNDVTVSAAVPALVRVKVRGELTAATATVPKLAIAGVRAA
jgi:hypothetical protein